MPGGYVGTTPDIRILCNGTRGPVGPLENLSPRWAFIPEFAESGGYDRGVGINEAIASAVPTATKLKKVNANEANTRALLIDPILAALGWDVHDLDVVEREVKVFDGTSLDYALKVEGTPRIYVEAKGVTGKLTDKKFVAQTVNYANNDGVVWCVLTNGQVYRVFKTNEPVSMDQKLLFEVDLTDNSLPVAEKGRQLSALSRESVQAGRLDALGERVFTDMRVRGVLAALASDPPPELLQMISSRLGHPPVSEESMSRSLARILDGTAKKTTTQPPAETPQVAAAPPKGQEYPLEHHLGNKSSLIRDLWEAIDDHASSLGSDVTHRSRKQYIGYFRGKRSFFTTEIQKGRVLVYLALTRETARPWNQDVMRDVSSIGHFGMGNVEYSLASSDQLPEVKNLITAAYNK